jgi:hypothetical protein
MADSAWAPDLKELFAELGVSLHGQHVTFDDQAPLAEVRMGITR